MTQNVSYAHPVAAERTDLPAADGETPEITRFPATHEQHARWAALRHGAESGSAHVLRQATLANALDRSSLTCACHWTLARHPALRTRFESAAGGRLEQVVMPPEAARNLWDTAGAGGLVEVDDADALFAVPPDPAAGVLWRIGILPAEQGAQLILGLHRLVADDASARVVLTDLLRAYEAARHGKLGAPDPAPGFGSYAAGHDRWLVLQDRAADATRYWQQRLGETPPRVELPTRGVAGAGDPPRERADELLLSPADTARLASLARRCDTELADAVLAAFAVLLMRYSGRTAQYLVAPADARPASAGTGSVGPYTTDQVRHLDVAPDSPFENLVRTVAAQRREAAPYADLPFERLLEAVFPILARDNGAGFDIAFRHLCERDLECEAPGAEIDVPPTTDPPEFGLCLETRVRSDGCLCGRLRHRPDTHDAPAIAWMRRHFATLLAEVAQAPGRTVAELRLVDWRALAWLSAPWPRRQPSCRNTVPEMIAAQARHAPDRTAIVQGEISWTYGELDARADRIARALRGQGVAPECAVGILMQRGPLQIAVLLGILRAGGGFVPMDREQPHDRLAHMLEDSAAVLLVTDAASIDALPPASNVPAIAIEALEAHAQETATELAPPSKDQLAYIIYTSGSTGTPKGVAVEHGPLAMHCRATADVYEMTEGSRELHFLSMAFDGAHERWMTPLVIGACVVLRDAELWSVDQTYDALVHQAITNAGFPPAYLGHLANWAERAEGPRPKLDMISFGGEAMPRETLSRVQKNLGARLLINGYGPTETVISPMVWKAYRGTDCPQPYAPIGRAVGDRRAFVLDDELAPVPVGVPGELYIAGSGLARGYHGRPEETQRRFRSNPFGRPGARMYRTGDRARWLSDGSVEFLGRVDDQVQLRGYRVELGEVEAGLRRHPDILEAAVAVKPGPGGNLLVGYAVPASGAQIDRRAVRTFLARELPDYMVPSCLVVLDRIPVTATGKTDRAALPVPEQDAPVPKTPPRDWAEEAIAAAWRLVLHLDAIGINDDFFELGGDSLTALAILAQLRKDHTNLSIGIADVFNNPVLRDFANILKNGSERENEIVRLRRQGARPHLYCFPGLLVSTREYVRLVEHLGPDQPATGFICYSLTQPEKPDVTVEEIAERYADIVRRDHAGGPCVLLGWSWGGILAFEAARSLIDEIDIAFVGMVDVGALDADFAPDAPVLLPEDRLDALDRRVRGWLPKSGMRTEWQQLLGDMDSHTYRQFLAFVYKSEEGLPTDGPGIGTREHTFRVLIENALIFRRYVMRPFDCPIRAWIADDTLNRGMNVVDWHAFSNDVRSVEIVRNTTHLRIIGAPAFHRQFDAAIQQLTETPVP